MIGGLLAHFKPWLTTEDEIRNRIDHRQTGALGSSFKVASSSACSSIDYAAQLRGAPPNEPDIVGDYVAETFRIFAVVRELDLIQTGIKSHYTYLYITAAIGLVGLLIALPSEGARPYVAVVCYAAIIVQIYCVGAIRGRAKRLEVYERTT